MNHDKSVDTISKNCNLNNISYYKSNDIQFLLFYIPFLFITLCEFMKFLFKFIYSFNYEFKELDTDTFNIYENNEPLFRKKNG